MTLGTCSRYSCYLMLLLHFCQFGHKFAHLRVNNYVEIKVFVFQVKIEQLPRECPMKCQVFTFS